MIFDYLSPNINIIGWFSNSDAKLGVYEQILKVLEKPV